MGRTTPITWDELTDEMRAHAAYTLMARHRVTGEQAMDVVNEAAGALIRRGVIPLNPAALLMSSAKNLLISERRKATNDRPLYAVADHDEAAEESTPFAELASTETDPSVAVDEREQRARREARVSAALDRLPEYDRLLLTAHYFEGREFAELDGPHGVSSGAMKSRVQRARERMREQLVAGKSSNAGAR